MFLLGIGIVFIFLLNGSRSIFVISVLMVVVFIIVIGNGVDLGI